MHTHRSLPFFGIAISLYLFQLLYNYFGHGVTSVYLSYAWVLPFASGLLFLLLDQLAPHAVTRFGFLSFNTALAALIFWSVLTGILAIAGSDSPYLVFYLYLAGISFLASVISFFKHVTIAKSHSKKEPHTL